jgi:hypothetical protein
MLKQNLNKNHRAGIFVEKRGKKNGGNEPISAV